MKNTMLSFSITLALASLATSSVAQDQWDPGDDTFQGATLLETPSRVELTHGPHRIAPSDPADWFFLFLDARTDYEFSTSGEAFTLGEVYDSDGVTLLVGNDAPGAGGSFYTTFTPSRDGKYYIKIVSLAGIEQGYTFHSKLIQEPPLPVVDAWDPKDDLSRGATDLDLRLTAEQIHGPHTLAFNDVADWYQFVLQAGSTYEFRSSGLMDTVAYLIGPDGSRLLDRDSGGAGGNFHFQFTPFLSGFYQLQVVALTPGAAGTYGLHYQRVIPPSLDGDAWDPMDDTPAGATDLGLIVSDERAHGYHSLFPLDPDDWFRVTLTEGTFYEFASLGDSDTLIELYAADGNTLLAVDDDGGDNRNFSLRFQAPASGEFFLRVRAHNQSSAVYKLLTRSEETPEPGEPILLRRFALDNPAEFTEQPGGFTANPGGQVKTGEIPSSNLGIGDGQGVTITTAPGQVQMLIFPTVETDEDVVLLRVAVHASGPGAEVALAALDARFDGTITADRVVDSMAFVDDYQYRTVLYQPVSRAFHPIIQVANSNLSGEVSISFDNLEVYVLPREGSVAAHYFAFRPSRTVDLEAKTPNPVRTFGFHNLNGITHIPGGFINAPAGLVSAQIIPFATDGTTDGRGLSISLPPGAVELLLLPEITAPLSTILLRVSVRSTAPGAAFALAVLDGSVNGSIGTNIPADSALFQGQYRKRTVLFNTPSGTGRPVIQVSNFGNDQPVTVYVDNLDVFVIPPDTRLPGAFFHGE